jgi:hypothetical protein
MRISMKSIVTACCLGGAFALGFLLSEVVTPDAMSLLPEAQAQADRGPGSRRCSSRTLKGAYGVKFEGLRVGIGPIASVSRFTFDGEGIFTASEIGRFNGSPVQRSITGQYSVNEDCTGILSFTSNVSGQPQNVRGDFVIVDGGQEFFLLDNSDNWVANGVGKRL